jgi:hypothetical protein
MISHKKQNKSKMTHPTVSDHRSQELVGFRVLPPLSGNEIL